MSKASKIIVLLETVLKVNVQLFHYSIFQG